MISKELLSAVFNKECEVLKTNLDGRYVSCYMRIDDFRQPFDINIYELAHKCKEWAYENIKTIPSKRYIGNLLDCYSGKYNGTSWEAICTYGNGETESFIADTEPEATFKACQWILDNKETK